LRVFHILDGGYRRVFFPGINYRTRDRKTVNAVRATYTNGVTGLVHGGTYPGGTQGHLLYIPGRYPGGYCAGTLPYPRYTAGCTSSLPTVYSRVHLLFPPDVPALLLFPPDVPALLPLSNGPERLITSSQDCSERLITSSQDCSERLYALPLTVLRGYMPSL